MQRLDNLTQEEHRMATAQDLGATHVLERVISVDNDMKGVDERVQRVNKAVQDVIDGLHLLFVSLYRPVHPDRFRD